MARLTCPAASGYEAEDLCIPIYLVSWKHAQSETEGKRGREGMHRDGRDAGQILGRAGRSRLIQVEQLREWLALPCAVGRRTRMRWGARLKGGGFYPVALSCALP